MFVIITEHNETAAYTIKDAIDVARQRIEAGCKLVMIETPQGFIINVEDLEQAEYTLTHW